MSSGVHDLFSSTLCEKFENHGHGIETSVKRTEKNCNLTAVSMLSRDGFYAFA